MSNATTESALLASGLQAMRFGRGFLKMMLEKTPDELFHSQPYEGANHAAWVVGHLANSDDFFLKALAGQEPRLPKDWDELFGMNSKPMSDPKKYPSRTELVAALDERRTAMERWLGDLSDKQLLEPIEGNLAQFAPNRAQLGSSCSFHDAFHAAQISAARRATGLPPLF